MLRREWHAHASSRNKHMRIIPRLGVNFGDLVMRMLIMKYFLVTFFGGRLSRAILSFERILMCMIKGFTVISFLYTLCHVSGTMHATTYVMGFGKHPCI